MDSSSKSVIIISLAVTIGTIVILGVIMTTVYILYKRYLSLLIHFLIDTIIYQACSYRTKHNKIIFTYYTLYGLKTKTIHF